MSERPANDLDVVEVMILQEIARSADALSDYLAADPSAYESVRKAEALRTLRGLLDRNRGLFTR